MDLGYTDQVVWNTLHGRFMRFSTFQNAPIDLPLDQFRRTDTLLAYHVELFLAPIVGERLRIPLEDILSARETGNMFGKGFLWKRVFILKVAKYDRLAFAVSTPGARSWALKLPPPSKWDAVLE